MILKMYQKPTTVKDLRENGRVTLAVGEATGHHHSVYADAETALLPEAEFFEEPNGRRVLLVRKPCTLRHQEHGPITLDPTNPIQARQGDVLLTPIGIGAWEVTRQREYSPEAIRSVAD